MEWHVPFQLGAQHVAVFLAVVLGDGAMLRAAIAPEHHVARLPFVDVGEPGFRDTRDQFVYEGAPFLTGDSFDLHRPAPDAQILSQYFRVVRIMGYQTSGRPGLSASVCGGRFG